ncbi:DNA repair protein XRCC2-like isoform X1 [Macrobrachium rosenbergii]|uniref:DNA repair protein XRCC2-like isoform X1 n=1 Tax=Macrobrachium rosenbergii TaxID=79674 RepID=UPI0034D62A9E
MMAASSSKKIITLGSPGGGWSRPKKICIESETGLSLLARLETRPNLTGLDPILFPSGLQPGEIVQLTGHPGSGKSLMILHLTVSVLLPKTWKGIYLNGCEAGVIFVACNSDLNIWQLENMLKKKVSIIVKCCKSALKIDGNDKSKQDRISCADEFKTFLQLSKEVMKEEISKLVRQCLKNFIFLKCADSGQFAITLSSIDMYFQDNKNVSLVAVDSISAFYWWDNKFRGGTWYLTEQYYNKIFETFVSHIKKYKVAFIFARQTLFRKNRQGNKRQRFSEGGGEPEKSDKDYEFLGKEWAKSVTFKINLSILKCPVLSINQDIGSEFSHGESSECADVTKGQSTSSKEGVGVGKISNLRMLFCAALVSNQRRAKLSFTVHEEGIRWCN